MIKNQNRYIENDSTIPLRKFQEEISCYTKLVYCSLCVRVCVCACMCESASFALKAQMETDGQDRGSDGRIRGRHQGVNDNSLLAKTSASHLFLILT